MLVRRFAQVNLAACRLRDQLDRTAADGATDAARDVVLKEVRLVSPSTPPPTRFPQLQDALTAAHSGLSQGRLDQDAWSPAAIRTFGTVPEFRRWLFDRSIPATRVEYRISQQMGKTLLDVCTRRRTLPMPSHPSAVFTVEGHHTGIAHDPLTLGDARYSRQGVSDNRPSNSFDSHPQLFVVSWGLFKVVDDEYDP